MIYKTSEWVSTGHSDKISDYISEYILDRLIELDPKTRYALEVQIKGTSISLAGEITTKANVVDGDFAYWAKEAINEIGYTKKYQEKFGSKNTICGDDCVVYCNISKQSPDIAEGVDKDAWGDQGIFFGYYCAESKEGNGKDYYLAKKIGQELYQAALASDILGLDIKTQVTVSYDDMMLSDKVAKIICAVPMVEGKEDEGRKEVLSILKKYKDGSRTQVIINGTGSYCKHGPIADCGTTGRKLVVDFYGGRSRIGGGCVDAETEYLSEDGWKKISEYDGGLVGQITKDLKLERVKPERYIETFHENVYEISTEKTTNMVLSDNHNVLYRTSKGHLQKKQLKQILEESSKTKKGSHIDIPMTFTYEFYKGSPCKYLEPMARIVAAHCADGTVLKDGSKKYNSRIRVKKEYKINRLRKLFQETALSYEERQYSDGYTYFYYNLPNTSKLLCKQFKNPDKKTAQMLAEEVFKWDGSEKHKEFRTTQKEDADFMQFVLSGITGKAYSIIKHKKLENRSQLYVVRETKKTHSNPFRKTSKNRITKEEPQKMYCFTVPSGMLLLRRNNYIFCTANSPWTKDGTKADLTLNIFAHDLAKQAFIQLKDIQPHQVEVELSCCIGQKTVLMQLTAFDNEGNIIFKNAESQNVAPSTLIQRYNLDTPVYAMMCRDGLFTVLQTKKEKRQ